VALSSYEVEYIVAAAVVCQGVWLTWLLTNLTGAESRTPELRIYNQSAITLYRNSVFHGRSKHIDMRYHIILECVKEEMIVITYTVRMDQLANILTKAL
jgi:hypothetical protein